MKIMCGKKDDILKRKADWQAAFDSKKAKYEEQYQTYQRKENEVFDSVTAAVESELSGLNLDLDVRTSIHYGSGIEVKVSSNERNVHSIHKALSWTWTVWLDTDGSIGKESSSWSGLQATTAEQLDSLRETVKALEILNNMPWSDLLNRALPNWADYVTESAPSYRDKPDFDKELLLADIEEAVGANVLLEGESGSGKFYRGTVYYHILSQTPSMYTVAEYYGNAVKTLQMYNKTYDSLADLVTADESTYRVKKDAFMQKLVQPLNMIEY